MSLVLVRVFVVVGVPGFTDVTPPLCGLNKLWDQAMQFLVEQGSVWLFSEVGRLSGSHVGLVPSLGPLSRLCSDPHQDTMDDQLALDHDPGVSLPEDDHQITVADSNLFAYIRSTLAKSPIGSLFTSCHQPDPANSNDLLNVLPDQPVDSFPAAQKNKNIALFSDSTSAATTPRRLSRNFALPDVRQTISSLTSNIRRNRSGSTSSIPSAPSPVTQSTPRFRTRSRAHTISTITILSSTSASSQSTTEDTPPLTPETASLSSSSQPGSFTGPLHNQAPTRIHGEETRTRTREESEQIRQGKKPERPICYDVLIADISNDNIPQSSAPSQATTPIDEPDEWFGLAYTLELSRQDQASSGLSDNGEYSRSHKSWAAIHGDVVNPMHEYEEFHHWMKWHRAWDRYYEKRRIQRTFEFLKHSQEMAAIYLDEKKMRRWLEWNKAEFGDGPYLREIKADLAALSQYRRDPYYPPIKRNLAWAICRSRSSCCLRELRPNGEL
ncbi:hypothetical protein BXZ70DRAFT_1004588 [Cristinia sonorae]|uniref:Uncharacterized protein n=1 Tax=Cristinia sonorae TaxID=1940300 RepID=A0A8K0UXY1_9AGAR|nr:hypothetical protein BXZ70DRAFT_1004588 [Cristinia sonorae]